MSEEAVEKEGIATAALAGDGGPNVSLAIPPNDEEIGACDRAGAIPPRHPPEWYIRVCESNTALMPVIKAIVTNVDSHGHRFEPIIDLRGDDVDDKLKSAMAFQRFRAHYGPFHGRRLEGIEHLVPTPGEINIRKEQIRWEMQFEEMRLNAFFSACCPRLDMSFTQLRQLHRTDRLMTGCGYIEVTRDGRGDHAEFHHLKSSMMRARPVLRSKDPDGMVATLVPQRQSLLSIDYVRSRREFRTFAQLGVTKNMYFKEYGDPRIISARDGKAYPNLEALERRKHPAANEVIWLREPTMSALTVYGRPPWLAGDAVASGLRDAQIVNATHFGEKGIPQMMIFIQGARPDDKLVNTVKEYFKGVKGVENYHRVLILSATAPMGGASGGRVVIEAKPLRNAIPNDALFQNYEQACASTLRTQFRIAKLVIGLGEDINRATADAVLHFLEDQVFGPIRNEFDEFMNRLLLDMGILYWKFQSNSPISRSPKDAADITKVLGEVGANSINEIRRLTGDIVNQNYPRLNSAYADMPTAYLRGLFQAKMPPGTEPAPPASSASLLVSEEEKSMTASSVHEVEEIAREVEGSPSAARGVELMTKKGRTLVYVLPAEDIGRLLSGS
jgi:capsid portal protein